MPNNGGIYQIRGGIDLKKWLSLMVALIMLMGVASFTATAADEKVNLTFMSHTYGPWNEALTDQVAEYMALNPNVSIEYIVVPGDDLFTRLAIMMEAGTGCDITGV